MVTLGLGYVLGNKALNVYSAIHGVLITEESGDVLGMGYRHSIAYANSSAASANAADTFSTDTFSLSPCFINATDACLQLYAGQVDAEGLFACVQVETKGVPCSS